MKTKCPKGSKCSCGGWGRWEPMCEGIEEYVNQDTRKYPRERIFPKSRIYTYPHKAEENVANNYDLCFAEDAYIYDEKAKYFKTEEYSLVPFLKRKHLYYCYKTKVITKKQLFYILKYYYRGWSYSEIAEKYRKEVSTVTRTIKRGLDRLKIYLTPKLGKVWH